MHATRRAGGKRRPLRPPAASLPPAAPATCRLLPPPPGFGLFFAWLLSPLVSRRKTFHVVVVAKRVLVVIVSSLCLCASCCACLCASVLRAVDAGPAGWLALLRRPAKRVPRATRLRRCWCALLPTPHRCPAPCPSSPPTHRGCRCRARCFASSLSCPPSSRRLRRTAARPSPHPTCPGQWCGAGCRAAPAGAAGACHVAARCRPKTWTSQLFARTHRPPNATHPTSPHPGWLPQWWRVILVDVTRQASKGCGDLIFSSHITFILTFCWTYAVMGALLGGAGSGRRVAGGIMAGRGRLGGRRGSPPQSSRAHRGRQTLQLPACQLCFNPTQPRLRLLRERRPVLPAEDLLVPVHSGHRAVHHRLPQAVSWPPGGLRGQLHAALRALPPPLPLTLTVPPGKLWALSTCHHHPCSRAPLHPSPSPLLSATQ